MKFKLVKLILLGFILINILMPIQVSAELPENIIFDKLSIDEGLSNEYVTSIFQDSKGYMWIGTRDGLNRYDGERIKVYNCSIDNENTLSSTYINDIEEDSMGNIWIATNLGLDILDIKKNCIVRMNEINRQGLNISNLKITSLLRDDKDDIMWVGTENGLIRIDIKNSEIEALYNNENNANPLTSSYITCLTNGENNTLMVGTNYGLNIINKKNLDIENNECKEYTNDLYVYNIELDSKGNAWISTKEGIYIHNEREEKKHDLYIIDDKGSKIHNIKENKTYDFSDEIALRGNYNNNEFILSDSNNNIWISSSNGIVVHSLEDRKFTHLKKDINSPNYLTSNTITYIYQDFNGTMWIGTDKGINIGNRNNQFKFTYICDYKNNSSHDKSIVSILYQNGYYFIATKYNGVYIYDENNNLVKIINQNNNDELGLNNEYIKSLFKINEEDILVVTNKSAKLINTNDFSYNEYELLDENRIELSYIYSDGEVVWFSNTNDFEALNRKTNKFTSYGDNLKKFNINPSRIEYILQDNKDKNILWLGGTGTGLVKFHKENGVIEKYENNSLITNSINCMKFDNIGNLWIGTNIGLSKFDIKENKFISYTTANGLTNNFINSILVDKNNNLWISTNKGLNKLNIEKYNTINFSESNSVYGYQFNKNSSLIDKNGMIMFGSTKGLTYFNPNDIEIPLENKSRVTFGDIYIGKNNVIYDNKELILEYNDKDLYIEYFLPTYERINHITYEYMIEGIDLDWIYVDEKSSLDIKSLDSGRYTLKVRARDGYGNLTEESSINIKVKSPIWKTPLAYLVYTIIISVLAYYSFNYVRILQKLVNQKTMKLNQQLEENKKLSEKLIQKEKLKNDYFVSLSHELRTPINVISSTTQLANILTKNNNMKYQKAQEYMEIISRNCDRLLKIINDIIDSSKIESGQYKIHKKNSDIVYIVEEVVLSMSKFIQEKGLSIIIDPEIEEKVISFDETEIERCMINLIGNAVKFTPEGGEIKVYIKEVKDNIEITVQDNGIGISKEDQEFIFEKFAQVENTGVTKASSSGIGLAFVRYIVELHNGYIKLESEIGQGSKFTIVLPDVLESNVCDNTNI